MKYILLNESEKEIVHQFNQNGQYASVICSTKWGEVIVDNFDEEGYTPLKEHFINSKRFEVDDNGRIISGMVPEDVPLWCLRTVLKIMGLFDTVQTTINNMPETTDEEIGFKVGAKEGWEYSNTVLRKSKTTLFVQQVLNLTDQQVDDIFTEANKIEA